MGLPGARPVTRAMLWCRQSMTSPADPPVSNPQGKVRIPADFADGTSKTILHAEKYARCTNTDMAPPFRDGGNAWAFCTSAVFPWQPPPMNFPGKALLPGFAIPALASRGAPNVIGPKSIFQVDPDSVSGQLRSDAGLDGSRQRHAGWPGRRQRPHAGREYERRHLVGRRDAQGRRSAGLGLVESRIRSQGSAVRLARTPQSCLTPDP